VVVGDNGLKGSASRLCDVGTGISRHNFVNGGTVLPGDAQADDLVIALCKNLLNQNKNK
jgi:hypothetical protein